MNQEQRRKIQLKLDDIFDDIHDYYCLLREQKIRLEPSEYAKMVRAKVLKLTQNLTDEFDEEVEE